MGCMSQLLSDAIARALLQVSESLSQLLEKIWGDSVLGLPHQPTNFLVFVLDPKHLKFKYVQNNTIVNYPEQLDTQPIQIHIMNDDDEMFII